MYIDIFDLIEIFGSEEIRKLATPNRYHLVSHDLLKKVIMEEDHSDYSPDEIEAANAAKIVLEEAITYAQQEMNSYFVTTHTLPLSTETINNNPIKFYCSDIARYRLAKSHPSNEISKRYENAIDWLKNISVGKAGLYEVKGEQWLELNKNRMKVKKVNSHYHWKTY
jgi:phage gp36-like protein